MQRGQISFDLMIAFIAMIVFISALQLIFADVETFSEESSLKYQAKKIAYAVADAVTAAKILSDADSASFAYGIPGIRIADVSGQKYETISCSITVGDDSISVGYGSGGAVETIPFKNPGYAIASQLNCMRTYSFSQAGVVPA